MKNLNRSAALGKKDIHSTGINKLYTMLKKYGTL